MSNIKFCAWHKGLNKVLGVKAIFWYGRDYPAVSIKEGDIESIWAYDNEDGFYDLKPDEVELIQGEIFDSEKVDWSQYPEDEPR